MKISRILPIIGIILLIYIIWSVGWEKIINSFTQIPPLIFLVAFLIFIPRLFIDAYKWSYISKKQRIVLPIWFYAKIFLISFFYGSITPGQLGMHLRIYYLNNKSNASFEKCITNSVTEAMISFIAGLFLAAIGALILFQFVPLLLPVITLYLIANVIIFVFFLKRERGSKFFNFIIRFLIPAKYKDSMSDSVDLLYEDIPGLKDMVVPFFLSCLTWLLSAMQFYIISLSFNLDISFVLFIIIILIAAIAATIPISVGGLGLREGAIVYLLALIFGVSNDIAFVISIGGFLVKTIIPGVIGLAFSFIEKQ